MIEIWSDGSADNRTHIGGWGAVLKAGAHRKELSGHLEETTSQRAEMIAAIRGLEAVLRDRASIRLYSDSAYLVNAMSQNWMEGWLKRGWRTASGNTVKNSDLWCQLEHLNALHYIEWIKVEGHAGGAENENERAHELANLARTSGEEPTETREVAPESPPSTESGVVDLAYYRKTQKATSWPQACLDEEARFGHRAARLYPLINHNHPKEPGGPKIQTPMGSGLLLQVGSTECRVLLDDEPDVVYTGKEKFYRPTRMFAVEDVQPLEMIGGRGNERDTADAG